MIRRVAVFAAIRAGEQAIIAFHDCVNPALWTRRLA